MNEDSPKRCILVIDDTPIQLVMLGRILSTKYNVKMAKTGEEGFKLAAEHDIDLILLDLYMPGMTGFEVLSRLKESDKTKHIPVILVTGSASNEDEAEGLTLGAVDYIRKPFTEIVVMLRVEVHLRLVAQMKMIESFSMTDGLTGINNRRSFEQTVKSIWSLSKRENNCIGMLMMDIDKFKNFNDKYGHLNGDICLKTVAAVIRDTIRRESDSVYRWGGEEFMVLLPGTNIEGTLQVAENIRKNVADAQINLDGEAAFVTISIGAGAIVPNIHMEFDKDFIKFLKDLDKALYRAKENGRNRIERIEEIL